MKEYLVKKINGDYVVTDHHSGFDVSKLIEIPDGADIAFKKKYEDGLCFFQCIGENGADWCSETRKWISRIHPIDDWYFKNSPWQREKESIINKLVDDGMKFDGDKPQYTQPEELPFVDSLNDQYAEIEQVRQKIDSLPEFKHDFVNHPKHYCDHPSGIECIEITRHHDFAIGNAIKYLWRAGLKDSDNEIQDLKKAVWYIQDKIAQLENK